MIGEEITPEIARFQAANRGGFKPYRVPKPSVTLPRILLSERWLVREYEYSFGFDRRKHTTPASSVEEFMARNRTPGGKLAPLPKPPGVKKAPAQRGDPFTDLAREYKRKHPEWQGAS